LELLIALSGPIGVGKTSFGRALTDLFDVTRISTRQYILDRTGCANERGALQEAGDQLDRESDGRWVADAIEAAIDACGSSRMVLLDCARIRGQVEALRARFPGMVFHVHLHAATEELERRYLCREPEMKEFATYAVASTHGTEAQVSTLASVADIVLDADHSDPAVLAITAMAHRGVPLQRAQRLVDVIVGGQYGSEGKGNVCAHIAGGYGALIRIGGPNAGHQVAEPKYKYVQLPSGTGSNPDANVLIGAGSTLWLPQLFREMMDHRLGPDQLAIDPQAMVIDDDDRRVEGKGLDEIATTKQGVGAALARKILNRGDPPLFGPPVTLARDVKQLAAFVRDTRAELERHFRDGKRVLLEGTQGTALSIHHGLYPWVTSRETSASGCLGDAGISHLRVNRVILVVRTYPIRVEGKKSGWMGREIDWSTVASRSGIPLQELLENERGTVSGRLRRVAEFDWPQLRGAAALNGATEVAVTFADYLAISNRDARSFSDLTSDTQEFIRKVERVAGAEVTMVSKAFARDGVLDRGGWS
jgi:adenylosuccinate synthase